MDLQEELKLIHMQEEKLFPTFEKKIKLKFINSINKCVLLNQDI